LIALLVLGCTGERASAQWTELPPLTYPRYFHRAAAGPAGELIVFAGRSVRGKTEVGSVTWDTEIYRPEEKAWRTGHNAMDKLLIRSTLAFTSKLPDGTRRYRYQEESSKASPILEVPPGTGSHDGRAFWFGRVAPLVFDFATGQWGQGTPPRAAAVYFDEVTKRWVEETGTTPRQPTRPPRRFVTSVPFWYRLGSASAASPDGKIFISGGIGYPTEKMDRSKYREEKYVLLDSLESYDTTTETWKILAPMQRARQLHAAAVARDGKLYVFGGYGHRGKVSMRDGETHEQYEARYQEMKALGRRVLDSVEAYDPKTNTWEARAPMPSPRHAMGAALGADGKIYVVGGAISYSSPGGRDAVFVYDPAKNQWDKGPSLIHARFHHAIAAGRDGKIYAIGGHANTLTGTTPTATVEMLDTANQPKPEGW
jgi:N-acetylneuraminic acid mutarotase